MKKGIYIILVGLLGLTISVSYLNLSNREQKSTPDSGWDFDYDGGSSFDGGGTFDIDVDPTSHYDGGKPSGTPTPAWLNISMIVLIFVGIIALASYWAKHDRENPKFKYKTNPLYEGEEYNHIREKAFEVYKEVQYAWSNFDYEKLRKLLSDELYNNYVTLLEQLKLKNSQNIMEDIELLDIAIDDIKEHDNEIQYDIRIVVRQIDYVINLDNNKVVRGNKKIRNVVKYNLTYLLSKDKENYCPNCGAKLDSVASQVCLNCGSVVVSDKHDLILIKKVYKKL